jgi:membrane-associated phospholipid phosphatase
MSGLTAAILQQLTHRYQPNQADPPDPRLWNGPIASFEYRSFPTGHTTRAFALASLISSIYKDKIWIGILSYTIAAGVAWSRVYDNQHWPSDVFIGAALGFAVGKTNYHVMQGKTNLSMGISDTGGVALVYHL